MKSRKIIRSENIYFLQDIDDDVKVLDPLLIKQKITNLAYMFGGLCDQELLDNGAEGLNGWLY